MSDSGVTVALATVGFLQDTGIKSPMLSATSPILSAPALVFGGGGQPDSDMKVDFAEIGIGKIGKIGISDYSSLKYRFLANFGKIGNKNFLGISYFSLKICYSYRNIRSYPS